jgi:integrase
LPPERHRITEKLVKEVVPVGRLTFVRDDQMIGFGLQVTVAGTKSFIVEGRVNGRMQRRAIGSASHLTVEEARIKARKWLTEMHDGIDPKARRRAARQRSATLESMLENHIAGKAVKESTATKYRALFRRNLSDWLDRPIAEITPAMVRLRFESTSRHSVSEAAGVMRVLRAVCRRAAITLPVREDGTPMMRSIPTQALERGWGATARKTTRLDPEDLPAWWRAVEGVESEASRRALQALLVTGLRVNELLRLSWANVDPQRRKLTIRESKTGAFEKFIGPELAGWLKGWRGAAKDGDPVFGVSDLRAALKSVVKHGGKRITPHDARRTFLSFGERIGTPIVTLKKLVNHSTKNDVTLAYIHPSDDDLRRWAGIIERAILDAAEGGAVVPLWGTR